MLLSLLFTNVSLYAAEIVLARPEKEHVAMGVARIKREENHIAIKRAAFLGCLVAGGCWVTYKLFWSSPTPPQFTDAELQEIKLRASENSSVLIRIEKFLIEKFGKSEFGKPLPPTATAPQSSDSALYRGYKWFKSQTGSVLQLTAATALFYAMQSGIGPVGKYFSRFDGFVDKWLSHIFHDDTLTWYLESHTNFDALLPELESYAVDQQAFEDIWSLFIQQLEGTVAFMYIQTETMEFQNKITSQRAEIIAQTVLEHVEQTATTLEHAFASGNAEAVIQAVQEYQEKLNKTIEHFKFIELFRSA